MGTYNIRKGFPRITVTDDGSATKEIELVCTGYAHEKSVFNDLETTYTIGANEGTGETLEDWRVDSISVSPSPLNLPYNALGESGGDALVFIARISLSLSSYDDYSSSTADCLRLDRQVIQSGQIRMASMMGEWPSNLPQDPWIGSDESIACEFDTDSKRLDISGKPQLQAVGQIALTVTELRKGTFPNFKLDADVINAQGTRNAAAVWGFAAHTLLFQSVSVQQVKHSQARWTFKFLFDPKKFLDQIPFSMPLTSGPVPVNETTEIVEANGDTPAIVNHHFLAVWSSPYRVGEWTLTTLGLQEDYFSDLITGQAASSP